MFTFQVQSLISYHVVKVACGSGDAQTMCVTSDDNVWSWGDGDYGKLGHVISESCKVCIIKLKNITNHIII